MTLRCLACLSAVALAGGCTDAATASGGEAARAASPVETTVVGAITLTPCGGPGGSYCATFSRPLDPAGLVAGSIGIHLEWRPHADAMIPSAGTVVGISGGPGYGSTSEREAYAALFGALLTDHDMLLVDARGTGQSGAIRCTDAQHAGVLTLDDVAACGLALGDASDLYGTNLAADDMAAILTALGVAPIDLYGDSYGTYSAQVFAALYPSWVRTITLDASYPLLADDPFYPDAAPGIRGAFDLACTRSPRCAARARTTSDRVRGALATLRAAPSSAPIVSRGGEPPSPLVPADLAFVMNTAGLDPIVLVELDAALRALEGGDSAPIVRLAAEAYAYEEGAAGARAEAYSVGMFAASTCSDGPAAYDMTLAPHARQAAYETAVANEAAARPDLYAPFTVEEFLGAPLDYVIVPLCQKWPVASAAHPSGHPVPKATTMPDIPALVLTGDLDTITPTGEGDASAAEFLHAQRVVVPNGLHVTALYDTYGCTSGVVRAFIEAGGPVDASCAATSLPATRLVPVFATTLASVPPAEMPGASLADRQAIAAAATTASDALRRYWDLSETTGSGLRGGSFAVTSPTSMTLTGCRWVGDLSVDGTVTFEPIKGGVSAALTLGDGATGTLTARWDMQGPAGVATLVGTVNAHAIDATMPAP